MPVYHLTTPTSEDEESDESREPECLTGFVPRSGLALAQVTGDRTSKWLEDLLKFTIPLVPEQEKGKEIESERLNTIDVKRHRVFSTTVDVHPKKQAVVEKTIHRAPREGREEVPVSWLASEIFNTASQAAELKPKEDEIPSGKKPIEMRNVEGSESYDDIESLMGDYFEDLKERGSDCCED
jgi:hypothetical protein